jgi:hypothetical protein
MAHRAQSFYGPPRSPPHSAFKAPHVPDIFDEVSEDLRAERARALLRRYGAVLVGLMVLTLIAVGVYDYLDKQAGQTKSAAADKFIAAQESFGRIADNPGHAPPADLTAAFADIAHNGPYGYRILASLQLAALDWDAGHHDAAIASWKTIAADSSAPQLLRDLATVTSAQHQVDSGDPAALKAQLLPLIQGANRWRPVAEQITALLDIRLGRTVEAQEIMKTLVQDANAPPGVRQMAQDLLLTMTEDAPAQKGAGPHG